MTEIKKERITQEEIFRQEIRKEIEDKMAKSSQMGRLWKLLNSSFALWFLSTIVVGVVTFLYSSITRNDEKNDYNREIIRKLNLEISSRLKASINFLEMQKRTIERAAELYEQDTIKSALSLREHYPYKYISKGEMFHNVDGMVNRGFSIFPEYANRNLLSLLFELESLTTKKEKKELIKNAIKGCENIEDSTSIENKNLYSASPQLTKDLSKEVVDSYDEVIRFIKTEIIQNLWNL